MLHQAEFGLGSEQRVADMRAEVGRNRLETRLREGVFSEGLFPRRRSVLARSAAFAAALFR